METTSDGDLQSQVLQGTLAEVAKRAGDEEAECCVICLEAITKPCELWPCAHANFDLKCIALWLSGDETKYCPLCKAEVFYVLHGDPLAKSSVKEITRPPYAPAPPPNPAPPPPVSTRPVTLLPLGYEEYNPRRENRRPRPRPIRRRDIVEREEVYRKQRYCKHVGSNRLSRYRELTPRHFTMDTELVSRARMFIRRELQVFPFLYSDRPGTPSLRMNNAEFLLEYIIAILKSVDIMGSGGQASEMLSDFLGADNARLFLHELRGWLRSPYTKLEDWDRAVQYDDEPDEDYELDADDSVRTRNRGRYVSERYRQRYRRKGDFYRPSGSNSRQGASDRARTSRHEPYSRGNGH